MSNTHEEAREIVRNVQAVLNERHPLLAGFYDHPRLEKPAILQQPCPTCHTSGEAIHRDLQDILAETLAGVLKRRDALHAKEVAELREAIVEQIEDSNCDDDSHDEGKSCVDCAMGGAQQDCLDAFDDCRSAQGKPAAPSPQERESGGKE